MTCETIRELLEEYALGLLDADPAHQVAVHLRDCPDCWTIYNEYATTLAALPTALAAQSTHQLPAHVKASLLARLGDEVSTLEAAASIPTSMPVASIATAATARSNAGPTRKDRAKMADRQPTLRRLRWAFAIAALLLVASLLWSIRLNVVLARERALRVEYADLIGQQQELVLEIVDSNQTTRRVLRAVVEGSGAYGKVFTRAEMTEVVAMAARLEQPPVGQAYYLWLTQAGTTELAGVMRINSDGFGLLIHDAGRTDLDYERAVLTLQPLGAQTPLGDPVIAWQAEP